MAHLDYSPDSNMLFVGEGNFSYSMSICITLGSGANMTVTSYDTTKDLREKYPDALANIGLLTDSGAIDLHGVDARKMSKHPSLCGRTYDFIIYNFPHVGFIGDESTPAVINKHRELVRGFFLNAVPMLSPEGQCHVTHKRKPPFNQWHIPKLASECGLGLTDCADFNIEDYPGYDNKGGTVRERINAFTLENAASTNSLKSLVLMPYAIRCHCSIHKPYDMYRLNCIMEKRKFAEAHIQKSQQANFNFHFQLVTN